MICPNCGAFYCPEYDDENALHLSSNQDYCDGRCQKQAKKRRARARADAERETMRRQVVYGPDHFRKEHFPDLEAARDAAVTKAAEHPGWEQMYPYPCRYPGCGRYGLTTHKKKAPRLRGEPAPR
jgi:hypothetical protein